LGPWVKEGEIPTGRHEGDEADEAGMQIGFATTGIIWGPSLLKPHVLHPLHVFLLEFIA
jgi:hypothetical protein